MPREEIQKTSPGGVSKRPAPSVSGDCTSESDFAQPIPDLRTPLPNRNVPATLSLVCGLLGLLLAGGGYVAACGSPPWLAHVLRHSPVGMGTAALLAFWGLILGVMAAVERLWYPTAGGLLWAVGGLLTSLLTFWVILETLGAMTSAWS